MTAPQECIENIRKNNIANFEVKKLVTEVMEVEAVEVVEDTVAVLTVTADHLNVAKRRNWPSITLTPSMSRRLHPRYIDNKSYVHLKI